MSNNLEIEVPQFNEKAYRGNSKLKNPDETIEFTAEMAAEYAKCATDPIYFIKTYVKIVHVDYGIVPFKLWEFQEDMIVNFVNNRFSITKLPRQVGKGLRLVEDIPTLDGWKKMADIKVGDRLFDMNGKPCNVTFKSETHNIDCFKVTFNNGTHVVCDENHLWECWDYQQYPNPRSQLRTISVKQMYKTGPLLYNSKIEKRYVVPVCKPVEYAEKDLIIDPYLLGAWLGDGSSKTNVITMHRDDYPHMMKNFGDPDHTIYNKAIEHIYMVRLSNLKCDDLKSLNVFGNKHIPDVYLQSSVRQRLELLRGLMDTDGHIMKSRGSHCEITFSDKYPNLYKTVHELLCSLGFKVKTYNYTNHQHPSSTLRFCVSRDEFEIFKLPRKLNEQKNCDYSKHKKLQIVNIEKVESEPTQCITVDSPTHTFLCTKNYIPTHNTTTTVALILWYTLFNKNYKVALLANKMQQSKEILSRYQLAYENLPKWLQQGVVTWNKGSIELENGSFVLASATSSSAVRGQTYSMIYLDEFAHVPTHLQNEFYASTYPAITSGQTTKVIITSTPLGLNLFYKIWKDAEEGNNDYVPFDIHWSAVPGRDEEWKKTTIQNIGEERFRQEFECVFGDTYIELYDIVSKQIMKVRIEDVYEDLL